MVASLPAQRTPAIEWDEFVGGYRAGLIERNTARLGPAAHRSAMTATSRVSEKRQALLGCG
jgi:hypothetical protein